jgi:hypothetical protein
MFVSYFTSHARQCSGNALDLYIQEVPSSNLGDVTGYPAKGSISQLMCQDNTIMQDMSASFPVLT